MPATTVLLLAIVVAAQDAPLAADRPESRPAVDWPKIAAELNELAAEDQKLRLRLIELMRRSGESPEAAAEAGKLTRECQELDRRNTARLMEIVDAHGWPRISQVGRDAARSAFLIAQHAVHAPAFMKRVRELMEPLVGSGEINDADYALLADRVLMQEGKPQRYGSQLSDITIDGVRHFGPWPIEERDGVDQSRAKVGLPPLETYVKMCRQAYGIPDETPTIPAELSAAEVQRLSRWPRQTAANSKGKPATQPAATERKP